MQERTFIIKNKLGRHARPAAVMVQTAAKFKSKVKIVKDGQEVDGKSIMGLMTLAAANGTNVTIIIDGQDEGEAADVPRLGERLHEGEARPRDAEQARSQRSAAPALQERAERGAQKRDADQVGRVRRAEVAGGREQERRGDRAHDHGRDMLGSDKESCGGRDLVLKTIDNVDGMGNWLWRDVFHGCRN